MPHVFISYVHEDNEAVQQLYKALRAYDIDVWLDRDQLKPGYRWADAIREAIREGAFYIACFSSAYNKRSKTYMNEELTLAIEELRQRPTDKAWFIPVLLDNGEVPDRSIGAGETLRSLQWVNLHRNWNEGIRQILLVIQPNSARVYELIQALEDKSARVRIKAADELSLLGRLAISPLIQALDDENETVRATAAYALGEIGEATEPVIASLIANIHTKHWYANQHAIKALTKLGNPGMKALIQAINAMDTFHEAYSVSIKVLSGLGKPIITLLLEMLASKSVKDFLVYDILSKVHDSNAIHELTESLHHKKIWVRIAAAVALIGINKSRPGEDKTIHLASSEVLSVLIEGTHSSNREGGYQVCSVAIRMLGEVGEPVSVIVPTLVQVMNNSKLRCEAITALRKIGRPAEIIAPVLIKALEDREVSTRVLAIMALGEIGEPTEIIVPALIKTLEDQEVDIRKLAVAALGKIGKPTEIIALVLIKALEDPEVGIRELAVTALGEIGEPTEIIIPALIKTLDDPMIPVRDCSVIALGKLGKPGSDVVAALVSALKWPHNRSMRVYAAEALGKIGDPACIPALIELQNDQFEVFRLAATAALKQFDVSDLIERNT